MSFKCDLIKGVEGDTNSVSVELCIIPEVGSTIIYCDEELVVREVTQVVQSADVELVIDCSTPLNFLDIDW